MSERPCRAIDTTTLLTPVEGACPRAAPSGPLHTSPNGVGMSAPKTPRGAAERSRALFSSPRTVSLLAALLAVASLPLIAAAIARLFPSLAASLGFYSDAGRPGGGVLTPPVCRGHTLKPGSAGKPGGGAAKDLPTLFFVAGIEGAGVEFFTSLFEQMQGVNRVNGVNISVGGVDQEMLLTAAPEQVMDASKSGRKRWKGCPKLPYARQVYDFGAEITSRMAALQDTPGVPFKGLYARTRDVFPMSKIRTPLARPDMIALKTFDGVMYHLKVLVAVREVTNAVQKTIKSGYYAQDIGLLLRMAEDSLTYLDASLRALPCGSYAAINMDRIIEMTNSPDPLPEMSALAEQLAAFLDIEGLSQTQVLSLLKQAQSLWVTPQLKDNNLALDAKDLGTSSWLEGDGHVFFDSRAPLWPLLTALNSHTFFSPEKQTDWPIS